MLDNLTRIAVLAIGRKVYSDPRLDRPSVEYRNDPPEESTIGNAASNLVGSLVDDSHEDQDQWLHAPVIDLDFMAHLIPSSTPGNYHLYLDKTMPWKDYRLLLKCLAKVGIIEDGYAKASIKKGGSYVRLPGVKKKKHWFSYDDYRADPDPDDPYCACGKSFSDRVHLNHDNDDI